MSKRRFESFGLCCEVYKLNNFLAYYLKEAAFPVALPNIFVSVQRISQESAAKFQYTVNINNFEIERKNMI
jgi:hypothetical protein